MPYALLLNGASSAGKTTTIEALQEAFPEPLLRTGIDLLIREMLPSKFFLRTISQKNPDFYWQDEVDPTGMAVKRLYMGERGLKAWEGLVQATVGLLHSGNSVVIDEVAFMGAWQISYWRAALKPYNALFIGVHCQLEELEKREKIRKDRMPQSSRGQYFVVHENVVYDLEVDTSKMRTEQIVQKILESVQCTELTSFIS